MAVVTGSKRRRLVERIGLYVALSAFGIVMVFPFAVVAFGSLKEASDIFRFPPRLLPYSQDTAEVDGEEQPLFLVEGEERILLETVDIGIFAPPDDL
jgi:alpha-1,4-digalacturonate transport system permease protein